MKHTASPHRSAFLALALLALFAPACGKSDASEAPAASASAPAAPAATTPAPTEAKWTTHKPSGTRFRPPAGWAEHKDKDTVIYAPPGGGGGAVLAFESFERGTDPGKLILDVSRKLSLEGLDWKGGTRDVKFGKDQIPGRTAEGDCTVKGEPATYSYATLNTGSAREMLIIYAVKKSAARERKVEAMDALKSIERY